MWILKYNHCFWTLHTNEAVLNQHNDKLKLIQKLTLLDSEWPKLNRVFSAIGLMKVFNGMCKFVTKKHTTFSKMANPASAVAELLSSPFFPDKLGSCILFRPSFIASFWAFIDFAHFSMSWKVNKRYNEWMHVCSVPPHPLSHCKVIDL